MLRAVSPCHNVGRILRRRGGGDRGGVMRRSTMWHVLTARHVLMAAAGLAGAAVTFPAMAQVPVPVGPDCVCLRIAVDAPAARWIPGCWRKLEPWERARRPTKGARLVPRLAGVELLRRDLRTGDHRPSPAAPGVVKTAAPPGMAGDTLLVDQEQQRVAV